MTQLVYIVAQLVFMAVAAVGATARSDSQNLSKTRKQVMEFSVIPSLFFAAAGHLIFGKRVRRSQGWGSDMGTVTLQREVGLMELIMGIASIYTVDNPQHMANVWAVMLIAMGLNHVLIKKKITTVAALDIVYGCLLLAVFA